MKPTLLVLAAGMGSRYGGLKQLDALGPNGETIMDYSIYDALQAGFGKVVFVIRKDFEKDFREKVLSKYEGHIPVEVVFQGLDKLPEGYSCPEGRTKPWGTNHAIMMGQEAIHEPFAAINADDFYGRDAFKAIGKWLSEVGDGNKAAHPKRYCMVGFRVANTMTENGSVSRGVCEVGADGKLKSVTERTAISFDKDGNVLYEENGNFTPLRPDAPVSMNLWGFTPDYFDYSEEEFSKFLDERGQEMKSEFYIPSMVDSLLRRGEATVEVLDTDSKWFGVTYADDRQGVVDNFARLHRQGVYPEKLF